MSNLTARTSIYRGVSYDKTNKNWIARDYGDGRQQYLGSFKREIDAAIAVDKAIIRAEYPIQDTKRC